MKRLTTVAFTLVFMLAAIAGGDHNGVHVGDEAPTFKLKNIDGSQVALSDYNSEKGVIVIFTCNHCPFSKKYEDRIIELDKEYKAKGFPVVAINPNDAKKYPSDNFKNMKVRAKEKGFTFPYLHDETQAIAKAYGAARTPHVFLLDNTNGKGDFKVAYIGAIDDDTDDVKDNKTTYVEDAIAAIEKGKDADPAFTKAIGCTIKWK